MAAHSQADLAARGYTFSELMVAAAAREIADGELVFVGMRLPMLAFLVARRTHAPCSIGLFENGVIRETPSTEQLYTMGDPPNLRGATQCGQMLDVMGLLQQRDAAAARVWRRLRYRVPRAAHCRAADA